MSKLPYQASARKPGVMPAQACARTSSTVSMGESADSWVSRSPRALPELLRFASRGELAGRGSVSCLGRSPRELPELPRFEAIRDEARSLCACMRVPVQRPRACVGEWKAALPTARHVRGFIVVGDRFTVSAGSQRALHDLSFSSLSLSLSSPSQTPTSRSQLSDAGFEIKAIKVGEKEEKC